MSADKQLPRGIRSHNPGNIERDGTPWQGLALDQSGDSRFCVFSDAVSGIRALARILITYQDKHGLGTVRQMIQRWAPPAENDTEAYVQQVARAVGVSPDSRIDVHAYTHMEPLVQAIIRHENGDPTAYGRGAKWYAQWQIDEGLHRVGVLPERRAAKVVLSPEAVGSGVAGAAGLTAAGEALLNSAAGMRGASDGSVTLTILVTLAVVAGVALTVYGVLRRGRQ